MPTTWDTATDKATQELLRSRARKSMSILEDAFIHNGSGRYLPLRTEDLAAALNKPVKRRTTAKSPAK
jgi:hypothetical protein